MSMQNAPIREDIQPMPPVWSMWFQSLVKQFQPVKVAALPKGSLGDRGFVTDALGPIWGAPVAGAGTTPTPVYHDGTVWRVG
jgi:hypothetical protein